MLQLETEEFEKLLSLNRRKVFLRDEIANVVIRQNELLSAVRPVESELISYNNELVEKYGQINVNMSDGTYTIIEQESGVGN